MHSDAKRSALGRSVSDVDRSYPTLGGGFRERMVSDIERKVSDIERRVSDIERRFSEIERKVSDIERRVSNKEHRVSDIERGVSDLQQSTSDERRVISAYIYSNRALIRKKQTLSHTLKPSP